MSNLENNSMHIAASNPMAIDKKDIKEDVIEKEKRLLKKNLKSWKT